MDERARRQYRKARARKNLIKKLYKRLWFSIISILVMLAVLVGSTFAWFSSDALTEGNRMKTGVMAIELLMSKSELQKKLAEKSTETVVDPSTVVIPASYKKYIRKLKNSEGKEEDQYIVTDTETSLLTFKNAEPGQIYKVTVRVANVGQLALTYTPTFEIQKEIKVDGETVTETAMSLTGLETLEKEWAESLKYIEEVLEDEDFDPENDPEYSHDVALANKGYLTHRDYEIRKRVLVREQIAKDPDTGETLEEYDLADKEQNLGEHLENVLKVYIGEDEDDIKDENYVGTVAEIIARNAGVEPTEETPVAADKYKGYLLPYSEVQSDLDGGKTVKIKEKDKEDGTPGDIIETITGVTECGELHFLMVLPEHTDKDNLYEYASLTLKVGARATQVEYEQDGLGIMIYDKDAAERVEEPTTAEEPTTPEPPEEP